MVVTLEPYGQFADATVSVVILVALLVCLIPTTIGALLSAIGIAGMDRLVQRNVLAMSGRAVEAAGDVQTLLLDKTGTITLGNRMASAFYPVDGHSEQDVASAAQLASLSDETPEGRSIVVLAKERFGLRERELARRTCSCRSPRRPGCPGLDFDGRQIRKGAVEAVRAWVTEQGGTSSAELDRVAERIARSGATPLAVAVCRRPPAARRHRAQGHGEGRHPGAVRRAARGGHPHRDDHRRQPAHGGGHRPGGRGR